MFWKACAYITLSCWPKMQWRATFWTSMGFLYQLGNVSIPVLQQQCEWFRLEKPKSPWSDNELYLSITRSPDAIKTALSFARNCNLKQCDNIDRLVHALQRANEKTASDYDANAPVYNEETCEDFHHLLLGLLLAHRQSLIARRELADAEKKVKQKSKQKKRAKELRNKLGDKATAGNVTEVGSLYSDNNYGRINADIWNYSDLLWRVVLSQAYHDHLEVIKPLIHRPLERLKGTYSKWFSDAGLEAMAEKNRGEVGNGQEAKGVELPSEDEFGNSDDARSGFDSFKQWMSLHVSYFEALRILSLKTKNGLKTSFIVSNPRHNSASRPLNWHNAVRKLGDDGVPQRLTDSQANKAIEMIQDVIDSNLPNSEPLLVHFGKSPTNDEKDSRLKPGEVRFIGRDHCEAQAAACSKYPDKAAPMDPSLQGKVYFDFIDVNRC